MIEVEIEKPRSVKYNVSLDECGQFCLYRFKEGKNIEKDSPPKPFRCDWSRVFKSLKKLDKCLDKCLKDDIIKESQYVKKFNEFKEYIKDKDVKND